MTIKELWPTFGVPVAGAVMGIYHKYVICPMEKRITIIESRDIEFIETLTEMKTDIKWLVKEQKNGKK